MNQATDLPQFQFLGKLGTGGTAEVYKVLTQGKKTAALKTKLQTSELTNTEFQKLADREKTLLENIDYPGIVKLYDIQLSEPCYICLELCQGKTLEQYNKIDDIKTALNILSSIAVNLEYLHSKSIVHADLKPDNIFMPEDISVFATDHLTYTKLSDFSLGKFESEENSVRAGLGTIGYMAPETIQNKTVSHQSDLFALGVIAYQILTGKHPFITSDSDPVKINGRILEEEPELINSFRNDVPLELIELVNSLLAKQHDKRPQSAWDVCKKLASAGASYPYQKAMHPKYFIMLYRDFESQKNIISNYQAYIDTITNKKTSTFRYILSFNFQRENLTYNNKQFQFIRLPLIPVSLIKYELRKFLQIPYSRKKEVIKTALQIDNKNLISLLLPQLLSTSFIKKLSEKLAKDAFQEKNYANAAYLYIQSGNLSKAEDCAFQAAMKFKNSNAYSNAFEILERVIRYGDLIDKKYEIKSLLMVKADLLKDIGETEKAEQVYLDLISLYDNQIDDEFLAEVYKDLGDLFKMKKKPKVGITYLEKALKIFIELKNELEISKTYNNLGNNYIVINDFTQALHYFRQALHIQKKLSAEVEVASTLNNIGVLHAMTSKFQRALKIFNISLKIQKNIGNKGEIARTLNNIGYCFEILGNTHKAVETLEESLKYNKEIDSKREILFNLENLTALMYTTGKLKESIVYLREGITLASELHDEPHIGIFNLYMGSVLMRMGKLKEASKSFSEVETILESVEDNNLSALLFLEKAQTALYINNIVEVENYLLEAEKRNKEIKDKIISLKILLLKISYTHNLILVPEAEEIISELELSKERANLEGLLVSYKLHIDNSYNIQQAYTSLVDAVEKNDDNIEHCKLLNIISSYELQQNNLEQAAKYNERSITLSKSRGLVLDLFNGLVIKGSILSKQNNIEQCYTVYKQGLETAKSIFNQLESDEDKLAFQNKKEFIFLVSEIKKLSQILNTKKEQV